MWGALIGLAGSAISSAIGGASAAKKMRDAKRQYEQYYKDSTQRSENTLGAQQANNRALAEAQNNELGKQLKEQGEIIAATDAVMGGDGRRTARYQQQMLNALAKNASTNTTAVLNANNQAINAYASRQNALDDQRAAHNFGVAQGEANAVTTAASSLSNSFGSIATADLMSHLDTGKGLFEQAFKKK